MNVASLELCKELHELSGWEPEDRYWMADHAEKTTATFVSSEGKTPNTPVWYTEEAPAYDLGYLLRKLPPVSKVINCSNERTQIYGALFPEAKLTFSADTPEDAACKLAIELFKQKVLKP